MKLSKLFSNQVYAEEQPARPAKGADTAYLNRQIQTLVPGQTISGEIVSRTGAEVQLKLAEDMLLNARVDRNLNLEIGRFMTFEVKNNGSALMLSPLFTNVSTDTNVLKALEMASLPINDTSVAMTKQLMEAGLPVNKSQLQQIFREINCFLGPDNQISDIISLHRLQLPVNEENVSQIAAYRNLQHYLVDSMENLWESLNGLAASLADSGDVQGALRLLGQLLQEEPVNPGENASTVPSEDGGAIAEEIPAGELSEAAAGKLSEAKKASMLEALVQKAAAGKLSEAEKASMLEALAQETATGKLSETGETSGVEASGLKTLVQEAFVRETAAGKLSEAEAEASIPEAFRQILEGTENPDGISKPGARLSRLLADPEWKGLVKGLLLKQWTVSLEDVADPDKVKELYRRLGGQLKRLAQGLESQGQTDTSAYKAVTGMSRSLDFMQQVNQMYAYVQLPLRLAQHSAHGELYVYTNKKRLSQDTGTISALLHLDMDNLGPLDVYVTLQEGRVSTNFKVQDEETLDFLEQHMELLTRRLSDRGYDCSCSVAVREDNAQKDNGRKDGRLGGLEPLLQQEGNVVLSQYAFDVRT